MAVTYNKGDHLAELSEQGDKLEATRYVQWIGCLGVDVGDSIVVKEVGRNQGILAHFIAPANDFKDRTIVMGECRGIEVTTLTSGIVQVCYGEP